MINSHFDYIVVGAGSAGCVLANRLSADPQVSVCMLEAGPRDKTPFIRLPVGMAYLMRSKVYNWHYYTEPQAQLDNRRLFWPRGRTLGGSSAINAMIYTRGVPADYDRWAELGCRGWSWRELLPYFKRAEDNERGADHWHGSGGPLGVADPRYVNPVADTFVEAAMAAGYLYNGDFNGDSQEGVGRYQITHREGQRCSAARAYLEPAELRPNLTVIANAQVAKLNLRCNRAEGVTLLDGHRFFADREVILSAGAITSPQLLLLSGIGPAAELEKLGIPVRRDLPGVGRNLQDHLDLLLVKGCREAAGLAVSPRLLPRGVKGLWDYCRQHRGMLTSTVVESGGFIKSHPALDNPDLQLHLSSIPLKNHGLETEFGYGWSLHICNLRPRSRGHIGLHNADPRHAPLIQPNYLSEAADMRQMIEAYRRALMIMEQESFDAYRPHWLRPEKPLEEEEDIRAFIRAQAESIYHPVGSCKMGVDEMAVVDPELRLHGMQGLRVVDASIMPELIGGNTNAPTIAIAEKAADLILIGSR